MTGIKKWVKVTVLVFSENLCIVSKNGGNGSSGRTRGPLLLCNNESVSFLDCT